MGLDSRKIISMIITFTMIMGIFSSVLVFNISTAEAHILVIGDTKSDLPHFYELAQTIANDLKSHGYHVLELYQSRATAKNILKGMYDADAVIYVGHGGYQTGRYDLKGGRADPPFALVGSDKFIYGIGDQMREGWDSKLFYAPFKPNIPVIMLNSCFSFGRVYSHEVANPIETIYHFSSMFTGAGANYYATGWSGQKIIYDFLDGAVNFREANQRVNNHPNYNPITKSTSFRGTLIWRNDGGYSAFVGDWNGKFPTPQETTRYDDRAAENWYNSDRIKNTVASGSNINGGESAISTVRTNTRVSRVRSLSSGSTVQSTSTSSRVRSVSRVSRLRSR